MRRSLALALTAVFPLSLMACSDGNGGNNGDSDNDGGNGVEPSAETWLQLACGIHEQYRDTDIADVEDEDLEAFQFDWGAASELFRTVAAVEGDDELLAHVLGMSEPDESAREVAREGLDETCAEVDARELTEKARADYICAIANEYPDEEDWLDGDAPAEASMLVGVAALLARGSEEGSLQDLGDEFRRELTLNFDGEAATAVLTEMKDATCG